MTKFISCRRRSDICSRVVSTIQFVETLGLYSAGFSGAFTLSGWFNLHHTVFARIVYINQTNSVDAR